MRVKYGIFATEGMLQRIFHLYDKTFNTLENAGLTRIGLYISNKTGDLVQSQPGGVEFSIFFLLIVTTRHDATNDFSHKIPDLARYSNPNYGKSTSYFGVIRIEFFFFTVVTLDLHESTAIFPDLSDYPKAELCHFLSYFEFEVLSGQTIRDRFSPGLYFFSFVF